MCQNLHFCTVSLLLQSSWVISVELAIGPEEGISYLTDKGSTVSVHTDHRKLALLLYFSCLFRKLPALLCTAVCLRCKVTVTVHHTALYWFASFLSFFLISSLVQVRIGQKRQLDWKKLGNSMQITAGLGKQNSFQHWVKYFDQGHDYGSRGIDPPTFQLVDDLLYR